MSRYKTFVATGIAPDGRLYAGDLNGIQDAFVSLSDFTQTLDVGTLRVGDPSLQLLKYGTGEFRMSGSLRIDGILRALGGFLGGAFTTTQRDAIPLGSRPYGLVILNTTTNRYEWNAGTDASPSWQPFGVGATPAAHASTHSPGGSDALLFTAINLAGTRASKPAASSTNAGLFYFETDWNAIWRSTGSAWVRVAHFPRYCTVSQFGALPDFQDADEVIVEVENGVAWHLRYNAGMSGSYKWEMVGGSQQLAKDDAVLNTLSTTYQPNTPVIQIPRAGIYDVTVTAACGGYNAPLFAYNHGRMTISGPGLTASDANCALCTIIGGAGVTWAITKTSRVTFTAAGQVNSEYRTQNAQGVDFVGRTLQIQPVAIT